MGEQFYKSDLLRDAIAKTSQHPLLESWIWFLLRESFCQNFVHSFGFLMSFSARGAIDQMRVKCAPFVIRKVAVQIGGQPAINFVVDRCHTFSPLKREPGEVVCALKPERGRVCRAARHWSDPGCFR